ncbi:hypothetical protein B0J13DRAFT_550051 [Dactylonectria estremocensis]|uniref:Uncharacterized protein n=1 Tax=Dactylonectria estremocensis TaxID=1079267 RepID=A0A9P9F1I8_9HYPO|nr:hypothetical protein B0J13DRAFT_550051 [Dactylonectria estremocensis]
MDSTSDSQQPWFLQSSYPVSFPAHDALNKSQADFEAFLRQDLSRRHDQTTMDAPATGDDQAMKDVDESETFTLVTDSTSAEIRRDLGDMQVDDQKRGPADVEDSKGVEEPKASTASHPFMDGLLKAGKKQEHAPNLEGMMRTENGDLAFRSTNDALVDLFTELEEVVSGPRLSELLQAAWGADPLGTLKIIFNARSIHLGKSSKRTFYRCAGWLAQNHPLTLVANLRWLSRPVIEKKARKEGEDEIVIVDHKDDSDPTKFDVQYGVAHGYWKDLLNILALAANNKLDVLSNPRDVLNTENPGIIRGKSIRKVSSRGRGRGRGGRGRGGRGRGEMVRGVSRGRGVGRGRGGARTFTTRHLEEDEEDKEEEGTEREQEKPEKIERLDPKEARHRTRDQRHEAAVNAFNTNPVYRALHLTIARLFAEQLEVDLRALRGDDAKAKRNISLCGKWAPSHDHFHDKHTFVVSSIAEILYPRASLDDVSPTDDRDAYLRHARERYRKDTSALRKQLDIVERHLSANTVQNIKYDRVPSIAMSNYSKLFIQKDLEGFEKYIGRVAEGKANISGATLLPSTLMQKVRSQESAYSELSEERKAAMSPAELIKSKVGIIESKVVDGQWNTLVQRIKDSGSLENSLAICDVSASMFSPLFPDKTTPMDSAIGLSLLIAEVTKPPFGGSFVTFSSEPEVVTLDLSKSLAEKYSSMSQANWGMSTNFVAVFERLILPIAIENNLKREDMVKRVFVFSDMQFNQAGEESSWDRPANTTTQWATSFERIKSRFEDAGYDLPELVFWNLAGGRSGMTGGGGDPTAPKPVTSTEDGTCLVSGYSQGMLKVFLDNGGFEEAEEEEGSDDEVVISKDGDEITEEKPKKRAKMDPITVVKKAIGHKAYDMLQVVD